MFGAAAALLAEESSPSPFQRDLRDFGLLIARLTLVLVLGVLVVRVAFGRPVVESLLFAVALAVGLTPELLPMITTVTLARGALRMARRKVIVKRLAAIHDLGEMTVLCTDKTGTLTSAEITLARSLDPAGVAAPRPARLGAVAAALGGDRGPLDAALVEASPEAATGWRLVRQRPFDYAQRTGSVLAYGPEGSTLIVKGAPEAVLAHCTALRNGTQVSVLGASEREATLAQVRALATQGLRAIAVASRQATGPAEVGEADLVLEGICAFADPPKPGAAAALAALKVAGVRVKILSGDDPAVVRRLAGLVGLDPARSCRGGGRRHGRRGAGRAGPPDRRLWAAQPRPEGPRREGAPGRRRGGRVPGRRDQRRPRPAARGCRPVGRRRERRRAGGCRHDPSRPGPRGRGGRRGRGAADLGQHSQVHPHGGEFEFR